MIDPNKSARQCPAGAICDDMYSVASGGPICQQLIVPTNVHLTTSCELRDSIGHPPERFALC